MTEINERLLNVLELNGYSKSLGHLQDLESDYLTGKLLHIDSVDGDSIYLRKKTFVDTLTVVYCDVVDSDSSLLFAREEGSFTSFRERLIWAFTRIDWMKESISRLIPLGYTKEKAGAYVREAYEKRFCFEFKSGYYYIYIAQPAKETDSGVMTPPVISKRRSFLRNEGDLLFNVTSYEKEHLVLGDYPLMNETLRDLLVKERR